ncbi:MAG: M20/M25/M40 family metallo-hydrolase, partial [Rhizobium sp.]
VVGEPTSMQLALGHKGKLAARATCRGVAGHSSMAPNFCNAIHLAADFVQILRHRQTMLADQEQRDDAYGVPYSTVHVGVISGGVALNIVADTAIVDFEIRNLAGTNIDDVLDDIRAAAAALIMPLMPRFPDAAIEISVRNAYPGLDTAADARGVAFLQKMLPESETTKVSYGTEAGLFSSRLGLETVVVGPGSMDQGHTPDEFIDIDQLHRCDAMLADLVAALGRP